MFFSSNDCLIENVEVRVSIVISFRYIEFVSRINLFSIIFITQKKLFLNTFSGSTKSN
jgi:hypothetical protein